MNRRARMVLLALAFGILVANPARSQIVVVPTPEPTVTAENEPWYLNGEPITYAGNMYYPAGAAIHFMRNEMVRSGFYRGIPLYTRTTIEPYSIVYVPLAGGVMQPYQRPRTGELTGTAGSTPNPLPVPPATVPPGGLIPQAASAPSPTARIVPEQFPRPAVTEPVAPPAPTSASEASQPVGTTGRVPTRPSHVRIGGRPSGTNAIFIEYEGVRWYPMGPPREIDVSGMVRLPDYQGFEVWTDAGDKRTIYIPAARGSMLVVPYTRTRPAVQIR